MSISNIYNKIVKQPQFALGLGNKARDVLIEEASASACFA
jgi:hypothetical protein